MFTAVGLTNSQKRSRVIQQIETMLKELAGDLEACADLAFAITPESKDKFSSAVRHYIPTDFPKDKAKNILQTLLEHAGKKEVKSTLQPALLAALKHRKLNRSNWRTSRHHFIEDCRINPRAINKDKWLRSIPSYSLPTLGKPCPPKELFIAETSAIEEIHNHFIYERALNDNRPPRRFMARLQPEDLVLDLKPSQSAMIYDEGNTDLIGCVIRDACHSQDAIDFVDKTIVKGLELRKNLRVGNFTKSLPAGITNSLQDGRYWPHLPLWAVMRCAKPSCL